jgi:phosphate starvation-inducible PhoH-like protein
VEAGERIGFLPGTKEEKFEPYFRPYKEVLSRRLGSGFLDYALKHGVIEAAPLNFIRGWTFDDCAVVLDEAQNCTPGEMKLFLTRIGENCKIIVTGDPTQQDIAGHSGLMDAVDRCHLLPSVGVVYFTRADVVRSGLVQQIVEAYEQPWDAVVRPGAVSGRTCDPGQE